MIIMVILSSADSDITKSPKDRMISKGLKTSKYPKGLKMSKSPKDLKISKALLPSPSTIPTSANPSMVPTELAWIQMGSDIDGEAEGDRSGQSFSLSSDGLKLAIGAFGNDGNGSSSGHVRVFSYNSDSDLWVQLGPDIDGEAAGDWSGRSVSLSSDGLKVAIGAFLNDGNGLDSGHVRVFQYKADTDLWVQMGPDINGEAAGDDSGHSVSLSSDGLKVAIGAFLNDGNGSGSGHVRVFRYESDPDLWVQMGPDIDGEAAGDGFGWSVSLSSDGLKVAIGARFNDGNGINSGHVRVFSYNSDPDLWVQMGLDLDGEAAGDYSGFSVSLSSDGLKVAIGSDRNGNNRGHVRVFKLGSN